MTALTALFDHHALYSSGRQGLVRGPGIGMRVSKDDLDLIRACCILRLFVGPRDERNTSRSWHSDEKCRRLKASSDMSSSSSESSSPSALFRAFISWRFSLNRFIDRRVRRIGSSTSDPLCTSDNDGVKGSDDRTGLSDTPAAMFAVEEMDGVGVVHVSTGVVSVGVGDWGGGIAASFFPGNTGTCDFSKLCSEGRDGGGDEMDGRDAARRERERAGGRSGVGARGGCGDDGAGGLDFGVCVWGRMAEVGVEGSEQTDKDGDDGISSRDGLLGIAVSGVARSGHSGSVLMGRGDPGGFGVRTGVFGGCGSVFRGFAVP